MTANIHNEPDTIQISLEPCCLYGLVTGKILAALWKPLNILWNPYCDESFLVIAAICPEDAQWWQKTQRKCAVLLHKMDGGTGTKFNWSNKYVARFLFCVACWWNLEQCHPGFVRVLENLESPGILLWDFPGLESPGKRPLVVESSGPGCSKAD